MARGNEPPELLEREDTLDELQSMFAGLDRSGATALVCGEAGAGKTSVIRRFVADLGDEAAVLDSRCDGFEIPAPLAPILEIAEHLELDPKLVSGSDRSKLLVGMVRALEALGPSVWIIDDLHWADGATLDIVRYVGRRIDRIPTLLIATLRDDEIAARHMAHPVVAELERLNTTTRLGLHPLSEAAVAQLVGRSRAPKIHRITGGNPFFVTELANFDATEEEIPESIRDTVEARLQGLTDAQRELVELASLTNRFLDAETASELLGSTDEDTIAAIRSGLLFDSDDGLVFRHDLVRRAAETTIPVPRRRRLHRRLLAHHDARDSHVAVLAHHAVRSGDARAIATFCPRAAEISSAAGAMREAAHLATAALNHPAGLNDRERVELAALDVTARTQFGDLDGAMERSDELVAFTASLHDPVADAGAWLAAARVRYQLDAARGREAVEHAVTAAEQSADQLLLADALAMRAFLYMFTRTYDRPHGDATRALALVPADDLGRLSRLTNVLGCCEAGTGDPDLGIRLLTDSLALAEQAADQHHIAVALNNLGSAAGEIRRYQEADYWLRRCHEHAVAHDLDFSAGYSHGWLVRILVEQGEWERAEAEAISRDGPAHSSAVATLDGALGRLGVRRGEHDAATRLAQTLGRVHGTDLQQRWALVCSLAEDHWLRGQPELGLALLEPVLREAYATDSSWAQGECAFWYDRCGGQLIDEPAGRNGSTPFHVHIAGDWRGAAEAWDRVGCPYEAALARADGEISDVRASIDAFERLGARPAADWARQRLRDLGASTIPRGPRPSTLANPLGLTRRQAEVLELAAEGLTNSEIAARLFVSPKTAEHHMSAILTRLGVDNRADAVEILRATTPGQI